MLRIVPVMPAAIIAASAGLFPTALIVKSSPNVPLDFLMVSCASWKSTKRHFVVSAGLTSTVTTSSVLSNAPVGVPSSSVQDATSSCQLVGHKLIGSDTSYVPTLRTTSKLTSDGEVIVLSC